MWVIDSLRMVCAGEKFWMNKPINNWTVFKKQFHKKMFIWQYRWNLKQAFRSHWNAFFFRYLIQLKTNIKVQVADAAFSTRGCESNFCQFTINMCFNIVIRGDWLWKAANINDKNNSAAVYVGSTLKVHNPLFSVGKLLRNKLMQRFYWSIQSKW